MNQQWILLDERTGLHVSWYFWLRVLDEVSRATRYGTPFALLLLEGQIVTLNGKPDKLLEDSASSVPQAIRSTDLGGSICPGRVAILLTQQDAESARSAQDRVLERIEAAGMLGVRWVAKRLLFYPENAGEISKLLTDGWLDDAPGSTAPQLQRPA